MNPKGHANKGFCDCGNVAYHRFNGWECDRCQAIRLWLEHENRQRTRPGNPHREEEREWNHRFEDCYEH